MITEIPFIAYFENLATQHSLIQHNRNGRNAFFYVPAEYDLREIDNALRSGVATPLLMLDCPDGMINDNGAASHHDDMNVQITILEKTDSGKVSDIRLAREKCKPVGFQILQRMLIDKGRKKLIQADVTTHFQLNQVKYDPVGPIASIYYGYTFRVLLRCPFGFKVDDGTWLDIPAN